MMARMRTLGRFWYEFLVGDDWQTAAGVVVALAIMAVLARVTSLPLWWVMPVAVLTLLPWSIRRAVKDRCDPEGPPRA